MKMMIPEIIIMGATRSGKVGNAVIKVSPSISCPAKIKNKPINMPTTFFLISPVVFLIRYRYNIKITAMANGNKTYWIFNARDRSIIPNKASMEKLKDTQVIMVKIFFVFFTK